MGAGLMLNYANANAPLATVALLLNARIFPLTALAGYALQERIDSARWFGICVGFAGIFVVLMPNLNGAVWSLGILAALAASLMSSGSQIAVKALTNTNSALTVAAFSQLAFMFLSAPIGLYYWSAANVADIAMIGVAAAGSAGAAASPPLPAPAASVGPARLPPAFKSYAWMPPCSVHAHTQPRAGSATTRHCNIGKDTCCAVTRRSWVTSGGAPLAVVQMAHHSFPNASA